mgnify:CR=1 FL=1
MIVRLQPIALTCPNKKHIYSNSIADPIREISEIEFVRYLPTKIKYSGESYNKKYEIIIAWSTDGLDCYYIVLDGVWWIELFNKQDITDLLRVL